MTDSSLTDSSTPGRVFHDDPRPSVGDRLVGGFLRRPLRLRLSPRVSDERGDVPGWVLITLMTAGLVLVIWGLAGPALSAVFEQAISRVSAL